MTLLECMLECQGTGRRSSKGWWEEAGGDGKEGEGEERTGMEGDVKSRGQAEWAPVDYR